MRVAPLPRNLSGSTECLNNATGRGQLPSTAPTTSLALDMSLLTASEFGTL